MAVKIKDIAAHLGIAPSTVSKALNGYPNVSAEMRQSVIEAAQTLGYVPNTAASNLRRQKCNKLGFVYSTSDGTLSNDGAKLMTGAVNSAEQAGYHITVYALEPNDELEWQLTKLCRSREVDGVLLCGTPSANARMLAVLQAEKTPFVLVGQQSQDKAVASVHSDEMASTYTMTRHLLHMGYRRIAYTTQAEGDVTTRQRFAGYKIALEEAGIAIERRYILPTTLNEDSGYLAMHALLDLPQPPTAVFANHDVVAFGCWRAATERGLLVPNDVAIAGFGNWRLSLTTRPPLTTIRPPLTEMGARAVQLLAAQLANPNKVEQVALSAEIIVRGSTHNT